VVERVDERGIVRLVQREEPPVEQRVDRRRACAPDHELGPRLAERDRSLVDQLARLRLDPQGDAALRLGRSRPLRFAASADDVTSFTLPIRRRCDAVPTPSTRSTIANRTRLSYNPRLAA